MKHPPFFRLSLLFLAATFLYALFRAFTDLGPRWPLALLLGLFLLFFFLDIFRDVRREKKAAQSLEELCDPEPLLRCLEERLSGGAPSKANLRTQLSYASALFLLGRREEGEQILLRAEAFLPQGEGKADRIYFHLQQASLLLLQEDLDGARAILNRSAALLEGRAVPDGLRKSLEGLTLQLRIQTGDPGDTSLESDLRLHLVKAATPYTRVCASFQLGHYYLSRKDLSAARPHLELVVKQGGKLQFRQRARELLSDFQD